MSNDYFKKPGLSFHQLKDLAIVSPRWYQRKYIIGEIQDGDKDSYRIGRLVHMAVLEPEKFAAVPTVPAEHLTPSGALSTKAPTREWLASLPNRDFGTPDELALCRRLQEAVMGNTEAATIVNQSDVEVELFREIDGVNVKAKADLIRKAFTGRGQVWDLKTSKKLDDIARECREYGYVEQLAWYARLYDVMPGGLIVVEKEEPYRVIVVRFAEDAYVKARTKLAGWMGLYKTCVETGTWPNDPLYPITLTAADLAAA